MATAWIFDVRAVVAVQGGVDAATMRYCEARGPAPQLRYWFTSAVARSRPGRVEAARLTA